MPRFERSAGELFEIELDGLVVRTWRGSRVREHSHATEDAARFAYGRAIQNARRGGFIPAGPAGGSRQLAAPPIEPAGSTLLVDEYFATADDRFLDELLRCDAGGRLAALAERWFADARPWARRMLLAYIDDGCDRPEHKGLVKRLFKRAEGTGDDEAMAHFLVAFDGFGARLLVEDAGHRTLELLSDPLVPERMMRAGKAFAKPPQFTRATRRYLARRAYRYFRRFGRSLAKPDPARYGRGLRIALPLYRDEALAGPAQLLDAWGLVHALYAWSPVLVRIPRGIQLAPGRSLAELTPAPHVPAAWHDVFDDLIEVLLTARSQTVRNWTITWLRREYAAQLDALPYPTVKRMLQSPHDELVRLGGDLLGRLRGLETLPITEWMELLAIADLDVLTKVCAAVERHVAPARLTLAQCVELACARTAPVARLGLLWARVKHVDGAGDLRTITRLSRAGVPSVRAEGAAWATERVVADPAATPELLRDLCDAPFADARAPALAAAAATEALAPPALWFALTESPYDDVRDVVVRETTRWHAEAAPSTLRHVWTSATLAVHRGSTTKRRVPRAIADRIASHPDEARALLPILRLSLRSVRPAERATALAAIVRAIQVDPALRALATELIPELVVTEQVTA